VQALVAAAITTPPLKAKASGFEDMDNEIELGFGIEREDRF